MAHDLGKGFPTCAGGMIAMKYENGFWKKTSDGKNEAMCAYQDPFLAVYGQATCNELKADNGNDVVYTVWCEYCFFGKDGTCMHWGYYLAMWVSLFVVFCCCCPGWLLICCCCKGSRSGSGARGFEMGGR